jgi:divinyl protochlorophyllide a 8-vinyl-reductase
MRTVAAVGSRVQSELGGPALIGPNAIIRLAEAVTALHGERDTEALFCDAKMERHLREPPTTMVDEREVIALHRAGRKRFGHPVFAGIARLAGELTGDYILANRIPRPAQRLLKVLPAAIAARVLVRAIRAHAWTFVGSGRFRFEPRQGGLRLIIEDSPLARDEHTDQPLCDYYSATFQRIFCALVSPQTRVRESSCAAMGTAHCAFDVRFRRDTA